LRQGRHCRTLIARSGSAVWQSNIRFRRPVVGSALVTNSTIETTPGATLRTTTSQQATSQHDARRQVIIAQTLPPSLHIARHQVEVQLSWLPPALLTSSRPSRPDLTWCAGRFGQGRRCRSQSHCGLHVRQVSQTAPIWIYIFSSVSIPCRLRLCSSSFADAVGVVPFGPCRRGPGPSTPSFLVRGRSANADTHASKG
jgi:hypothetical protein